MGITKLRTEEQVGASSAVSSRMLPSSPATPGWARPVQWACKPTDLSLLIPGHCFPLLRFSMYLLLLSNSSRAIASGFFKPPIFPTSASDPFPFDHSIWKAAPALEHLCSPLTARAAGPEIINYFIVPQNWQPRLLAAALICRECSFPAIPVPDWSWAEGASLARASLSLGSVWVCQREHPKDSRFASLPYSGISVGFLIAFQMYKETALAQPSQGWGCKKQEIFTSVRLI